MQKQKRAFIKSVLTALTLSAATLSTMTYGVTQEPPELPISGPCAKKTWAMGNLYKVGEVVSTSPLSDKKKPSKNYVLGYDGMSASKVPLTEEAIKNASKFSPRVMPAVWKDISPKTRCAPPTEYVGVMPVPVTANILKPLLLIENAWPMPGVLPNPAPAIKPLIKDFVQPGDTMPALNALDPKTDETAMDLFPAILPEKLFILMFPNRHELYTYEGLQTAYNTFKDFAAVGDLNMRRRELAAFLANVSHETGGLVYAEQYGSATNTTSYCDAIANYPCLPEGKYFGRGAMQITWNNIYGRMIKDLNPQMKDQDFKELYKRPESVIRNSGASLIWNSAVWYWMNVKGYSKFTAHEAMILPFGGFGGTIAAINGKSECNGKNPEQAKQRIVNYQIILTAMMLPPTVDTKLECFIPSKDVKEADDKTQKEKDKEKKN